MNIDLTDISNDNIQHGDEVEEDEPEEVSEDDMAAIRTLKIKLKKYRAAFSKKLADVDFSGVEDSLDLDFLEEKYNEVRLLLCNNGNMGIISAAYNIGIAGLETAAAFSNGAVQLQGLSTNVAANDDIQSLLVEMNIEYGDFSTLTSPEQRLLMMTIWAAAATHNANKAAAKPEPVENLEAKYANI